MRFKIMGEKGDGVYDYDTIEMQRVKFDELVSANMLPVAVKPDRYVMRKFDEKVDEVLWIPRIAGG